MGERIRIERIAAGGEGVGRLSDGRVAFVPRAAPGDVVAIEVVRPEKRFVRAIITELVEPGPGRVTPRCGHYDRDRCGGCQLQHLDSPSQALARQAILNDAMIRIGKVTVTVPPVEPATAQWGYRSKISLTVGRNGAIGYHRVGEPGSIFGLERCDLAAPGVDALWQRVRRARRLVPSHASRVVLRLDRSGGEHLVVVTEKGPIWTEGKRLFAAIKGEPPLTVWWHPDEGSVRAVAGSPTAYPATAFEQVHPAMGDRVRHQAVERLGLVEGRRVWDLYAGIGETSELIADRGATQVQSVEWDRGAVEEADRRQQAYGRRIERTAGAVETVVASLGAPDLVITNPPRTGMDGRVIAVIRARRPERVVYVSCDPATLARDVGRFAEPAEGAQYRVTSLEGFDLFPQTAHLETVAVLERT